MEKFIYIGNVGSNLSLLYPAESWRGAHPASDNTLNLYFTPLSEGNQVPNKDNDIITLTTTDNNKHKEVLQAIVNSISLSDTLVTVIFDNDTGEKIHTQVSGVSYTASPNI